MDTKWVHIEQSSVNTSLSALPFLTTNALRKLRIQNEWVEYTLKVWKKIRLLLNLPLSVSRATTISALCDFLPAKLDSGLVDGAEKGLTTISQLFEGTTLKAFAQFQAKYGIEANELFQYFQLLYYLTTQEWDKIKESPGNFEQYWR